MPDKPNFCTPEERSLCGEGIYPGRRVLESFESGNCFGLRYSKPRWVETVTAGTCCICFCGGFFYFGVKRGLPLPFFMATSAALTLGLIGVATPSILAAKRNGRSVLVIDRRTGVVRLPETGVEFSIDDIIAIQQSFIDSPQSRRFDRTRLSEINLTVTHEGERKRFNIAKSSLTLNPFGFVSALQNALCVPLVVLKTHGPGVEPTVDILHHK